MRRRPGQRPCGRYSCPPEGCFSPHCLADGPDDEPDALFDMPAEQPDFDQLVPPIFDPYGESP